MAVITVTNPDTGVQTKINIQDVVSPPPSGVVYGCSLGTSASWSIANLAPKIIRTYSKANLASVPKGTAVMHSIKTPLPLTTAAEPAVISEYSSIEDIAGCYGIVWHEGDKDGLNTADYQAAQVALATRILPAVNAKRVHPIKSMCVVTGVALSHGNIAQYLHPAVDVWGVDLYDPHNISTNAAWIRANGNKPWCVPEMGYVAGGTPTDGDDGQKLARLKSDVATYLALPNPPFAILEFNNNGSLLGPNPLMATSAAWWKNLSLTGVPS